MSENKLATVMQIQDMLEELLPPRISETAIRRHIKREGIKGDSAGRFPVDRVIDAIRNGRASKYSPTKGSEFSEAKTKKLELECQILESKRDQLRGDLMTRAEHRDELTALAEIVRRNLEQLGRDVGAVVTDQSAVRLVDEKARECLERIHNALKS